MTVRRARTDPFPPRAPSPRRRTDGKLPSLPLLFWSRPPGPRRERTVHCRCSSCSVQDRYRILASTRNTARPPADPTFRCSRPFGPKLAGRRLHCLLSCTPSALVTAGWPAWGSFHLFPGPKVIDYCWPVESGQCDSRVRLCHPVSALFSVDKRDSSAIEQGHHHDGPRHG